MLVRARSCRVAEERRQLDSSAPPSLLSPFARPPTLIARRRRAAHIGQMTAGSIDVVVLVRRRFQRLNRFPLATFRPVRPTLSEAPPPRSVRLHRDSLIHPSPLAGRLGPGDPARRGAAHSHSHSVVRSFSQFDSRAQAVRSFSIVHSSSMEGGGREGGSMGGKKEVGRG